MQVYLLKKNIEVYYTIKKIIPSILSGEEFTLSILPGYSQ